MSKTLRQKICKSTETFKSSDIEKSSDQIKVPGGKMAVSAESFRNIQKVLERNKVLLTSNSLSYFVIPDGDKIYYCFKIYYISFLI